MKVVILEPDFGPSLAIAKYLKKYSDNVYVIGCWPTGDADNVPGKVIKSMNYDMYLVHDLNQELLDEYPVIIPTGNSSTFSFYNLREENLLGEIGFRKENLIVADKKRMLEICNELGVPIPYTYRPGEEIKTFPVFFKADHEADYESLPELGSRNIGIIKTKNDLLKVPEQGYLIQEYIPRKTTFCVDFIAQEGKIITHFIQEALLSKPITGGTTVIAKHINNSKLLEYTSRLTDKMKYHGWGQAEFIYCKRRNDYVFMEINPRFWANFEFSLFGNPMFGKLLFNIDYPENKSEHFIFVNRLIQVFLKHPLHCLKFLPQIISGHRVFPGGLQRVFNKFFRSIH